VRFRARVDVRLKDGISDPPGQTIERALPALGYAGVSGVRVGKLIELDLEETTTDAQLHEVCRDLLSNPVVEEYDLRVERGE